MAKNALPYDAEIEFLESTGAQYFMTGVYGNATIQVDMKAQFLDTSEQVLLGTRNSTRNSSRIYYMSSGKLSSSIGDINNISSSDASSTELHTIKVVAGNNQQRLYVDEVAGTSSSSNASRVSTTQLAMFALNYGGISLYAKARVYYCSITVSGTLVRDFIPVRVGAVGYMYDRVSGQLFGNAGTGDFILGPDK